jgi:probable rRNA maturation factor
METNKSFTQVIFHHDYKALAFPRKLLSTTAQNIYKHEKIPLKKNIHVIFCSDYSIKKLNAKFRKKPHPTDVLSFIYDEEDVFGEIYISLQRAKIQAKRYNVKYDDEILRLFVHGMMHIIGYDHIKSDERKVMELKESKYY